MEGTIVLITLPYWGSLNWWRVVVRANMILIDPWVKFKKQSAMNRTWIPTANGPLLLSVPVKQEGRSGTPLASLQIDERHNWRHRHWKTIYHVYRNAPFHELYIGFIRALYSKPWHCLFHVNYRIFVWCIDQVFSSEEAKNKKPKIEFVSFYRKFKTGSLIDACDMVTEPYRRPRIIKRTGKHYMQLFPPRGDHSLFWEGVSILDLLMMHGPDAWYWLVETD